jgi:hypothetical protein
VGLERGGKRGEKEQEGKESKMKEWERDVRE